MFTTRDILSILIVVSFWGSWLFVSGEQEETTEEHLVKWTPAGVANISHRLVVNAGDTVVFMCPSASYSTIWFITEEQRYKDCNCSSGCILVSNCQFFNPNNYSTAIQRISGTLTDTPDYHPGRTYYFASFSLNKTTLGSLPYHNTSGECSTRDLHMELRVRSNEDTTTSSTTSPSPEVTGDDKEEEEEEGTVPTQERVTSTNADGKITDEKTTDTTSKGVDSAVPLVGSSSVSLLSTTSFPLLFLLILLPATVTLLTDSLSLPSSSYKHSPLSSV